MKAYIDSDILIWHLRGARRALNFLKKIRNNNEFELWIGAMQRAEIVFFMHQDEIESTLLFLSQFKTATVDQSIVDKAAALYRNYHPSHGIDIHDTLLAATVIHTGGLIFSLNVKHYPMPEVHVQKAW